MTTKYPNWMGYGPGPMHVGERVVQLDAGYHERTLRRLAFDETPAFLRRAGRLDPEQLATLTSPHASWAPFRDYTQPREKAQAPFFGDRSKPVAVSVRGQGGVTRYEGMDAFEAGHDFGTYPVKLVEMADEVIAVATAKPWAGRDKAAPKPREGRSKADVIGDLLLRAEGCTTKNILAATGWPSVSVPAQAKVVGLALRKEKVDGATRYWGSKK